jgi:hypothetical protein
MLGQLLSFLGVIALVALVVAVPAIYFAIRDGEFVWPPLPFAGPASRTRSWVRLLQAAAIGFLVALLFSFVMVKWSFALEQSDLGGMTIGIVWVVASLVVAWQLGVTPRRLFLRPTTKPQVPLSPPSQDDRTRPPAPPVRR